MPLDKATKLVVSYQKYLIRKAKNPPVAPAIKVFTATNPYVNLELAPYATIPPLQNSHPANTNIDPKAI